MVGEHDQGGGGKVSLGGSRGGSKTKNIGGEVEPGKKGEGLRKERGVKYNLLKITKKKPRRNV